MAKMKTKTKTIITAGILIAGNAFSSSLFDNQETSEQISTHTRQTPHKAKRTATKVYHRFEEIPEIPDKDAYLYDKKEYTYIINADVYQKTGEIELKRVLVDEITQANALSLIYRSECCDYIPKENEDQIVCYDVEMKLLNPSGKYKGPSQMDDNAITSYVRFLAATPQTRQYVLPLLRYTPSANMPQTIGEALDELQKLYYDENGKIRPMAERNNIISSDFFTSIKLNDNAWQEIASTKLKAFINKESYKREKGLSNTTKNYLCLTELFPSKQLMQRTMEDYNLTSFSLGRKGKPKDVMRELALSMNLKDSDGNLDATRIPTYAIAASISHINWKGNGKYALEQAKQICISWPTEANALKENIKFWVSGKGKSKGVNELSQLNMITPTIIRQYQEIELAGADNLAEKYKQLVAKKEMQTTLNLADLAFLKQKQR